jgi:LytS/YehU family sensor histidine kinase
VEKYYFTDKKAFWIGQILVALSIVMIRRTFNYHYTYPLYYPQAVIEQPFFFIPKLVIEFVNLYLIVSLYGMFYFVRTWYEQQRTVQELEQEKANAELELLKLQVHPHFIFNTLNNIYSVTVKNSPDTANYLLKLASFLDYNLYDTKLNIVALEKEIEYIRNYVSLQQLRYGNKVDVSFNTYGSIHGKEIAPLLLLPLIENCFKHGVDSSIDKSWIRVEVAAKDSEFTIKIENSKESPGTNGQKNGGLGVDNVKRRLVLMYPDRHELRILDEMNSYMIVLKIKTA